MILSAVVIRLLKDLQGFSLQISLVLLFQDDF